MVALVLEKAEAILKPLDSSSNIDPNTSTNLTALNEEEQHIKKWLRWKLDLLIMSLVVTIYLMNYIGR